MPELAKFTCNKPKAVMSKPLGELFVVPTFIGAKEVDGSFPAYNLQVIRRLQYWVVENARDFRRFLRDCGVPSPYDHLELVEVNKRSDPSDLGIMVSHLMNGNDVGLVSDAGCPGIADPGSMMVLRAHELGVRVRPLVGPSSIPMALMSSGLNGQNFRFHGYLPVKDKERDAKLREMEVLSKREQSTQIFIETPYRNKAMLGALLKVLHPSTLMCVALDIQSPTEFIATRSIGEWNKVSMTLDKSPCVFLFQA